VARGDILVVDDPVIGAVRQQAPFPRISGQPPEAPAGAPRLGEHTDDVLTEVVGLTGDEIDEFRVAGVI
jgi:formyl-CoA transferase